MSSQVVVRRVLDSDRIAIQDFLKEHWGDSRLVNSRTNHEGSELPGFIVRMDGFIVGLLTYHIDGDSCEMTSLNTTSGGRGIGSMMLRSLEEEAAQAGCKRIWALTTNDNLQGLRFYQKRGYLMKAIYPNSIAALREIKPSIPVYGDEGIMRLSEVEVEKILTN